MIYRFEDAELDTLAFELRVGGERVPVEPQVFEVLLYLVERRGQLCLRTEILDAVWGDRFVSDSALASRVAAARAAIGDNGRDQRLIRTVHGRGLQFIAPVTELPPVDPGPLLPDTPRPTQSIRFCTSEDGHRLAVATVGQGRPLVKAANWLTHVEYDWDSPVWRHWMDEFAARFRFVRYDARGCGLSGTDLSTSDLSDLSLWTADLEAVIDSSDIDQCVLLGVSQGVAPALDYARRHPARVSHLILYGGYVRGMRRRGPEGTQIADLNETMIATAWGGTNPAFRAVFTTYFMPDATSEQMRWFNDLQAQTATPEAALALETAFYDHDISDLARDVDVPTLVLHCRDDMATPYEEGVRLAGAVPGAEFVTLESRNHLLTADEPAWRVFLDHLDRFTAT
jgi:pimeloyl-ACP methyl ester carboxylesterase/DNA-binding winged helix-turn-helix (wHTH) protein